MNVRLAVQILSSSVSNVLSKYGPPEAQKTARLCLMMDSFFDIVNIRNHNEYKEKQMVISWQSYEGLRIIVHSIVDCVKYLLNNNICKFVYTERFKQDPLENYFGRQRSLGARKDNPSLRDI